MKGKKKKPSYASLERRVRGMEAEALATSDRRLVLIDCLFSVVERATKLFDEKRALEALLEKWRQAEKDRLDRNAFRQLNLTKT